MSRRDTIIVAVLINVGLLAVLFTTAINTTNEPVKENAEVSYKPAKVKPVLAAAPKVSAVTPAPKVLKPRANPENAVGVRPKPRPPTETIRRIADIEVKKSQPAAQAPKAETVIVQKGDVLGKIAQSNGTTVSALMKENGLSSTTLRIGQELKLPPKTAPSAKLEPNQPAAGTYTIKKGDNLWSIARINDVELAELLHLNDMNEDKARRLKPGDTIRIR